MSFIRKLTKKVIMAPVEVVKGVADAVDETVNGPKETDKKSS